MGFASIDAMVKAYTNGRRQDFPFFKDGQSTNETPEAAGNWVSYYLAVGQPAAASAPSTSWAAFENGAGSMTFVDVSPNKRYVYGIEAAATVDCTLMIYDRLGHINFNANSLVSTGNKTVTATLPTRYSGADTGDLANIEAWIELTEATATTVPIVSLNSYTDESGNSGAAGGNLTFPSPAGTNIGWMAPFPLAAGDRGVSAINTFNVGTASTTSGECNVLLLRQIARVGLRANVQTLLTVQDGLPARRIYDDSSLCFAVFASSTSVVDFNGVLMTVYDGS